MASSHSPVWQKRHPWLTSQVLADSLDMIQQQQSPMSAWLPVQGSRLGPADVLAAVSLARSAAQPVADTLAGIACTAPQPAEAEGAPGVDPAALATMSRLMQVVL